MRGRAGKVALISGAGGPMGRAIAARLAAERVDLVLTDISGARRGRLPDRGLRPHRHPRLDRCLLRRLGQASEVADAIAFLSSDDFSYLTGEIFAMAGGNHPHL